MNPKLIALGGIGLVILALTTWGFAERSGRLSIKADYDGFIAKAQILAAERLAENQRKEAEYREALKTAEFARDAALNRLRDDRESARRRAVSITPLGTEGRVCFDRAKFDSVLQSFLGEVEAGLARGDCSIIEGKACYDAWPSIH